MNHTGASETENAAIDNTDREDEIQKELHCMASRNGQATNRPNSGDGDVPHKLTCVGRRQLQASMCRSIEPAEA